MTDIKIMVDAVRQLNQTWKSNSNGIEQRNISDDVYNALCEVDEAITLLMDKVGDAAKVMAIDMMSISRK